MDPKLRRAIWLIASSLLKWIVRREITIRELENDLLEAQRLVEVEVHEFEDDPINRGLCAHRYFNSDRCGKLQADHPLGLEPDGKTK